MTFFYSLFPSLFVWLLLGSAIVLGFVHLKAALILLGVSALSALYLSHLDLVGLAYSLGGLMLAAYGAKAKGLKQWVCHILVIAWCLSLALHLAPGFHNLPVLDQVVSGPNSMPYNLYFNLDKPLIFFALLLLTPNMLGRRKSFKKPQMVWLMGLFVVIFIMAMGFNLIRPELSLPSWWLAFVFANLLLTCVAEEAFFRGYIQKLLTDKFNLYIGLGATSVLFGLVHLAGGLAYAIVAMLAGVLYGLTYYWTGKLSYAILVHFLLNLAHLTLFTYPMVK